ncbi:MAG TPA: hypothetical protein VHP99_05955 [Pyrinomonadaceae bacterium]|jgi:hypothetical protein|nr:hypothetical protein [Pyrinomonadaceae bacterium]
MKNYTERNRALLHFIAVPTILLTAGLLGGLRIDAQTRQFVFIAPPLVTLVLAALLGLLFVRAGAIDLRRWIAIEQPLVTNLSHLLTLLSLFFATAQAFNSVLPESGLLHWMFAFFFLWTLWTNQFSNFDSRRLLRSIVVLFGTAFVFKHLLLSALYAPTGGWLRTIASTLLQGISIDVPAFAPATGYVSFFALVLYVSGLLLLPPAPIQPGQFPVMQLAVREDGLSELTDESHRDGI